MARLLLDTHVWLWMAAAPDRISAAVQALLADEADTLHVSAASSWEIAFKFALGELDLPHAPEEYVPGLITRYALTPRAVEHRNALHVAGLLPRHRDPFLAC